MKILEYSNRHIDTRRELTEFIIKDFPKIVETKLVIVKEDHAILGKHYHPYTEELLFVAGECVVKTWSEIEGNRETKLTAPMMIIFEEKEEHLLICEIGNIFIEYVPKVFNKDDNIPSKHIN